MDCRVREEGGKEAQVFCLLFHSGTAELTEVPRTAAVPAARSGETPAVQMRVPGISEDLAGLWHKRIRQELGFSSDDAPSIQRLFQQKYRGSRCSFGHPACPNREDRAMIMELLRPEQVGVQLSENFMLAPEPSTDAIVVHHPQAKYFVFEITPSWRPPV
jgi:hypothetical protein